MASKAKLRWHTQLEDELRTRFVCPDVLQEQLADFAGNDHAHRVSMLLLLLVMVMGSVCNTWVSHAPEPDVADTMAVHKVVKNLAWWTVFVCLGCLCDAD